MWIIFKAINDDFGHAEGDRILALCAKLLSSVLRQGDYLARYGGEEFTIVLPETEEEDAGSIAERIRHAIAESDWKLRPLTVSVGVASMLPAPGFDRNLLMARADQALYRAKRSGRNRVEHFGDWRV